MFPEDNSPYHKAIDVVITSAQLKALHATPVEVLPALPAGQAYIIDGCVAEKPAGAAYAAIDVADDILLQYTDGSGDDLLHVETTGFLDQTTEEHRYFYPSQLSTNASAVLLAIEPVESAAIVAALNNGEITTGDSDLYLRIYYHVIPMDLESAA